MHPKEKGAAVVSNCRTQLFRELLAQMAAAYAALADDLNRQLVLMSTVVTSCYTDAYRRVEQLQQAIAIARCSCCKTCLSAEAHAGLADRL